MMGRVSMVSGLSLLAALAGCSSSPPQASWQEPARIIEVSQPAASAPETYTDAYGNTYVRTSTPTWDAPNQGAAQTAPGTTRTASVNPNPGAQQMSAPDAPPSVVPTIQTATPAAPASAANPWATGGMAQTGTSSQGRLLVIAPDDFEVETLDSLEGN